MAPRQTCSVMFLFIKFHDHVQFFFRFLPFMDLNLEILKAFLKDFPESHGRLSLTAALILTLFEKTSFR